MPQFHTTHFGEIEYAEGDVIEFEAGLPGFEHERKFLPLELPPSRPMILFQSLTTPGLCFMTLPVTAMNPAYRLAMASEDLEAIGLPGGKQPAISEVLCVAVLSVFEDRPPTANLLAPLVVNPATGRGVQAIQVDSGYSHQHELRLPEPEAACS